MFTLKFYQHNNDSYEAFSCERYTVSVERCKPETKAEVGQPTLAPMKFVVRMFRALADDNPYFETIGDREPYGHAFVVNENGRTIDTIR